MTFLSVTPDEWNFAKEYLSKSVNGTKLGRAKNSLCLTSKHSFIKIDDKIYCLAATKSSDSMIHYGSSAKTKYAKDEHDNLFVIKINRTNANNQEQAELDVLLDLSIGIGSDARTDKNKRYSVLKYLGKNLFEIIDENFDNLSGDRRLDIAIKLAYQVYGLHKGLLSASKTAYAHKDIKPDNVTVDEQGNVHLIDFGFTTKNPHEKSWIDTEAFFYTAYGPNQKLTGAELDVVALKRTLFLPQEFYGKKGYYAIPEEEYRTLNVLLPQNLLDKFDLNEFVNTSSAYNEPPDYAKQVMDPLTICAALINAKEHLGITNREIKQNPLLAHAIVGMYFSPFSHRLKAIISNPKSCKLAAALHLDNAIESYDQTKMDEEFCNKLNRSRHTFTALSLLKLKQLNLPEYYELILNSLPTAQVIEQFIRQNRSELIKDFLKHHSENLAKVLLFTCQYGLEHKYQTMINNAELAAALASLPENYNRQRLIYLLNSPEISEQQIITYCLDKDKRESLEILFDNDPNQVWLDSKEQLNVIKNILDDSEVSKAVINLNQLSIEKDYLYQMVTSNDKCLAFNVLFNANIASKETIIQTIARVGYFETIINLHELGLSSSVPLVFNKDTDQFALSLLLKSKHANKFTDQMLLDETLCKLLLENRYHDEQILCLITLYEKQLFSQVLYTSLKGNSSLFKQVVNVIKEGYSSCLNEKTLHNKVKSVKEFMLNVVAMNYKVLESADFSLKNDYNFMLAATAKNVQALEYASVELKSNILFMTDAVRINHQAFNYSSYCLNNNPALKQKIDKVVLNYEYAHTRESRFHLFSAYLKENDSLLAEYKDKKGDVLKTAILQKFKQSLEGKSSEGIDNLVFTFKKSPEYKILCTAQGITTSIFKLQTTSAKSVEKIIEDAHKIAENDSCQYGL